MAKKTKKTKKVKKVEVQKLNDNYLKYKGNLYEKLDAPGEQVELDLDLDLLEYIKSDLSNRNCLSVAEYVRMVLRDSLEDLENLEVMKDLETEPSLEAPDNE